MCNIPYHNYFLQLTHAHNHQDIRFSAHVLGDQGESSSCLPAEVVRRSNSRARVARKRWTCSPWSQGDARTGPSCKGKEKVQHPPWMARKRRNTRPWRPGRCAAQPLPQPRHDPKILWKRILLGQWHMIIRVTHFWKSSLYWGAGQGANTQTNGWGRGVSGRRPGQCNLFWVPTSRWCRLRIPAGPDLAHTCFVVRDARPSSSPTYINAAVYLVEAQ